jgi:hypothetical protein
VSPIHVPAVPEGEEVRPRGDFEPLPDAWHNVKVLDAEVVTASTGNVGIKLDLEVTDGPHQRRRIFDRIWTNPPGWFREKLSAFGVELPPGPIEFDERVLVGRRAAVRTEREPYTGRDGVEKVEPRVKAYDRIAGSELGDWRDEMPAPAPAAEQDEISF